MRGDAEDRVRTQHWMIDAEDDHPAYCEDDNEDWPCITIQALDEAAERIEELEAALRRQNAALESIGERQEE